MRKLVTIRQINQELINIPNADNIELARIDGWQCVVKKGEFRVGEYGVYFEIDSFVDTSDPRFEFLKKTERVWEDKTGAVIRTIRLRGQISQGLFLPLSLFPEITTKKTIFGGIKKINPEKLLDIDFAEELNVYKYDKEEAPVKSSSWQRKIVNLFPRKYRGILHGWINSFVFSPKKSTSRRAPSLPNFLKKTDEERIQNIFHKLTQEQKEDIYEVTIKLDGSSAQYYVKDGIFGLASRNIKRSITDGSEFANIALRYNLPEKLIALNRNISICGELMGPGIQKNREGFQEARFFVFNIWDIDEKRYLLPEERDSLLLRLIELGCELNMVPIAGKRNLLDFITIEDILLYAEGPSINNLIREGLVFRSITRDFSFKVISNKYLLEQKE